MTTDLIEIDINCTETYSGDLDPTIFVNIEERASVHIDECGGIIMEIDEAAEIGSMLVNAANNAKQMKER